MKKLYVVGIGAGNYDGVTVGAVKALEASEVIVGYTAYCELVKPYFPDKEYISTPMMKEIERCRMALESAQSGKLTAMICSGDAGIYGMASPILELAEEYGVEAEESELFRKAEAFAIRANGRSPRTAKQFIQQVAIGLK